MRKPACTVTELLQKQQKRGKIVLKKPRLFATIRGTYESLAEFYIVEETAARDLTHF